MKPTHLHTLMIEPMKIYCDTKGVIPYCKVRYVLRHKFRVPNDRYQSILMEFLDMGLLIRLGQRTFKLKSEEVTK